MSWGRRTHYDQKSCNCKIRRAVATQLHPHPHPHHDEAEADATDEVGKCDDYHYLEGVAINSNTCNLQH